jgi:hypothetical protein
MDISDTNYQEILAANEMEDKKIPVSTKPFPKTITLQKSTKHLGVKSNLNLQTGETLVTQKSRIYSDKYNSDNAFGGKRKRKKTNRRQKKTKGRKTRRATNTNGFKSL